MVQGFSFPVDPKTYTGLKPAFGGPSLEWYFSNTIISKEETEQKIRIGVRRMPLVISQEVSYLRDLLKVSEFPNNTANFQRKITLVGIPIVGRIIEQHPLLYRRKRDLFLESSLDDQRILAMSMRNSYEFNLGREEDKDSHSVYLKNSEQATAIRDIGEVIGLNPGQVTTLCLVAGLAQSVDPSWVPVKKREAFIGEVRFFSKWIAKLEFRVNNEN